MAVSCFAFNKSMSPLSRISAGDVKHYNSQMFMGYIDFQNVYFAFDDTRNYRPYMVFRGQVERLSAIEDVDENGVDHTVRIADKFDNIYFNHNKPEVMYKYEFSDAQLSELAKKGLWTKEGITIPEMFTSRTFMLEMYAEVEEVEPKSMQEIDEEVKKSLAPVLVVDIDRPFSNSFTEQIYELTNFMERNAASEFDKMEQSADMERVPMSGYDNAGAMLDALREKQEREAEEAERQKAELQRQILHDNANVYDTIAKVDERIEKLLSERDAIREVMRWVGPWSGCHSAICGGISTGFVMDAAIIWLCYPSCIVWKSDK